tara:strand:- start:504 stop:1178 length:675 start_codon:yes stop_codon:yes gene_type:complete
MYKLVSNKTSDVYIGACLVDLCKRLGVHKAPANTCVSKKMFASDAIITIVLIENFPCNTKNEMKARELFHITNNACININKPFVSEFAYNDEGWVKEYREANKEKKAEHNKEYREANKEAIAEQTKAYYEANKEAISEQKKEYREANKEAISEHGKEYREANKEAKAEYDKGYHESNKEAISERRKAVETCECGCEITHSCKSRHKQSKKHINLLAKLTTVSAV